MLAELTRRKEAYENIVKTFGFFETLCDLSDDEILKTATDLYKNYESELDECFPEECVHFKYFIQALKKEENFKISDMLQTIRQKRIVATFPNVDIALKIFLTIPATYVTGERSFSTLKRVKNYLRNSLVDAKTSNLALLCIENQILDRSVR